MRSTLRKIQRRQAISPEERRSLQGHISALYQVGLGGAFRARYASALAEGYQFSLPGFSRTIDDLCYHLIDRPELLSRLASEPLTLKNFPAEFHPYLLHTFDGTLRWEDLSHWLGGLDWQGRNLLPQPRQTEIVYKYETNNANKETGLRTHFERLSRFSFISRLQSYRYLTKNKAARAKIEVVAPDCLGGIFTNKEKSIYYYIFLTEAERKKAENACRLLNSALHGYEHDV
jgi:hypothetical protein